MPEIAEVRITANKIKKFAQDAVFNKINISEQTPNQINTNLPFDKFKIDVFTRGKEMKIRLNDVNSNHFYDLTLGLGMTGNIDYCLDEEKFKNKNHVHLWFEGFSEDYENSKFFLYLSDPRKFAKWNWGDFSSHRGPDMIDFSDEFKQNIYDNLNKKFFQKYIFEALMDQRYFNGVGNYLRAEIIGKYDTNPFQQAYNLMNEDFLDHCKKTCERAYELGGAELRDWKGSSDLDKKRKEWFDKWMKFYQNPECNWIYDSNNRKFWFSSKWKNFIPDKYIS